MTKVKIVIKAEVEDLPSAADVMIYGHMSAAGSMHVEVWLHKEIEVEDLSMESVGSSIDTMWDDVIHEPSYLDGRDTPDIITMGRVYRAKKIWAECPQLLLGARFVLLQHRQGVWPGRWEHPFLECDK